MPSWGIHRTIYRKLCNEVQDLAIWTPGLLEKIDKIIDANYVEHDLGVKPDPSSFERLLRALWLEFGDVYDTLTGKYLNADYFEKLKIEREVLMNPKLGERYSQYTPDDALALATLHHILDTATYYLLNIYPPITMNKSVLMFECAQRSLRHYINELRELRTTFGKPFNQVFDWLISLLKERSPQIYMLLVEYLNSKNLEPGLGSDALKDLLNCYVEKKGYYGVIKVNGKPLPLAAAANKIHELLRKGESVVISFTSKVYVEIYRSPPYPVVEELKVSSLKELFGKLYNLCKSS
jgi:hypothetical protein